MFFCDVAWFWSPAPVSLGREASLIGPCELRWLRRGVPLSELRFDRLEAGEDIVVGMTVNVSSECKAVEQAVGMIRGRKNEVDPGDARRREERVGFPKRL